MRRPGRLDPFMRFEQTSDVPMLMRFNLVDDTGILSFLAPGHVLKALTAICSRDARQQRDVIAMLAEFDDEVARSLRQGLSVFDEHWTASDDPTSAAWLDTVDLAGDTPFRVVDERTRAASLTAGSLGLVVVNLASRRIVQLENRYGELLRSDKGRLRRGGKAVPVLYRFSLPSAWSIVP